jgi:hypothetical protein
VGGQFRTEGTQSGAHRGRGEDAVAATIWHDSVRTDDLRCWGAVN